jgi:peroxiredoxin
MRMGRAGISGICAGLAAAMLVAGSAGAVQVGDKAPDFTLAAPGGKQVTLAELTAKGPVVIFTFIQAFTGA